jgi:hypothetical protein
MMPEESRSTEQDGRSPSQSKDFAAWIAADRAARDPKSRPIRESIANTIAATQSISVYLLDPAFDSTGLGTFPMPEGYSQRKKSTGIHAERTLTGEAMTRLLILWTAVLREDVGLQAACHYPIHGLRLINGGSVLYETSLCWLCNNYYVVTERQSSGESPRRLRSRPPGTKEHSWLGLPGGYPKGEPSPTCRELRELLTEILPIPEELVQKVMPKPKGV